MISQIWICFWSQTCSIYSWLQYQ